MSDGVSDEVVNVLQVEDDVTQSIHWFTVLTQLAGGLAFFFYGLNKLSLAMKRLAGHRLKSVIVKLTSNSCIGLLVGMIVTGISNSLTLISVLLVGFVGSGLVNFENTIPVLLGAGIGSTVISLLVALKVTKYGLLFIAVAYFYGKFLKRGSANSSTGRTDDEVEVEIQNNTKLDALDCVFGLGLIFFGSQIMGDTFGFLRTNQHFVSFLGHLQSPFLGLCTGFVLTVLVNSSGAAIGILLSLSEHGLLDSRAGIAMVLGANVGTCLTACLAGFSQGRGPLEVAVALVLVRTVGALFFTVAIDGLQTLVHSACGISIDADIALLAAEPGHVKPSSVKDLNVSCQIAASHTIFNVIIALAVLPFVKWYATAVKIIVSMILRDGAKNTLRIGQNKHDAMLANLEITVV